MFEKVPALEYAAKYEHARSLLRSGKAEEARQRFADLYRSTLEKDRLPPIDTDFRQAMLAKPTGWSDLLRTTAETLVRRERRPAILALAWQCWQMDDRPAAGLLVKTALDNLIDKERVPMTLASIEFFQRTHQWPEADRLVGELLKDEKLATRPALWRLSAKLAERRDLPARRLE